MPRILHLLASKPSRIPLFLGLALVGGMANAHTGHDGHSFFAGVTHPFAWDHLLAMFAVGLWSVQAANPSKAWRGSFTFLIALALGATLGVLGLQWPWMEHGIALSVTLMGVLILMATRQANAGWGWVWVAFAGGMHGLAHGLEAPAQGVAAYGLGFLLSTAALHLGGMGLGWALHQGATRLRNSALAGLGIALSGAGLYLSIQV